MDTRSGKRPLSHHPSSLGRNSGENGSTPLTNHPQNTAHPTSEALQQQERCPGSEKLRIGDKQPGGAAFGLQVRSKEVASPCVGSGQLSGRRVTCGLSNMLGELNGLLRD